MDKTLLDKAIEVANARPWTPGAITVVWRGRGRFAFLRYNSLDGQVELGMSGHDKTCPILLPGYDSMGIMRVGLQPNPNLAQDYQTWHNGILAIFANGDNHHV